MKAKVIKQVLEEAFVNLQEGLWGGYRTQEEVLDAMVAALEGAGFPAWKGSSLARTYAFGPEPRPHILILEEGPVYAVWEGFEMNLYRFMGLKDLALEATDGHGDFLLEEHARALRYMENVGLDTAPYWKEWHEAGRILAGKGLIPSTWTLPRLEAHQGGKA
ncbi:hypothetical protein [Thermus sp.]|uniref:hypothetical protein n=1 Tax=Thermus sp. TaxID=275 RepID=UPI002612F02A|nr:hypothetical protein [Thermus sp.]MCX7850897.1 hypothetical protein [Thermus sp.]